MERNDERMKTRTLREQILEPLRSREKIENMDQTARTGGSEKIWSATFKI